MKRLILLITVLAFAGCATVNNELYIKMAGEAMQAPTYEQAVKIFKDGTKGTLDSDQYYASQADIAYSYGHFVEAVNGYTRAMRLRGKAIYHLKRGQAYVKLHVYKDAIYDFTAVIDIAGHKMPIAYVYRAKAYIEKGKYKDAVRDLEKAKKRGGEDQNFLIAMGDLEYKMGNYPSAKTYVQKAIDKNTGNSELYYLRARIFYREKDANQAMSDLKKALKLDKNNFDAKKMLARVYATNPLSTYRNGPEALKLAKELYAVNKSVAYVEVLAAAYAENGQFGKAVDALNEGIRDTSDLVQKEEFRYLKSNYIKKKLIRSW